MKIAQFKSLAYGFITCDDEALEVVDGYLRISEYVEVEFVPLPYADVVGKEVEALREAKKTLQAETSAQLDNLDRKIGELLALPPAEV